MAQEFETQVTVDQAIELSRSIADLFRVQSYTVDRPEPGHIRLLGEFIRDLPDCFEELEEHFDSNGFTPFVREEEGQIVLIAAPAIEKKGSSDWRINLFLLIATIASMYFVVGPLYAASLLLILGAHEMGHYFAARHHKVNVTLPYFIPLPLSVIGTMGAAIMLKSPIKNKRALFDVGASGPIAGLIFAVPILIIGLITSDVGPPPSQSHLLEGNSLLYGGLKLLIFGQRLPDFVNNVDVSLNELAWAGWVGLLVTGLNLIPVGQLDGGHIIYALFGKKARWLFWPSIAAMLILLLLTWNETKMWAFWIFMLFVFGRRYDDPLDDVTPLDQNRRLLAIFTFFVFIMVFVPIPLIIIGS